MRKKQGNPAKNDRQYRKYSSEAMVQAYQAVKTKGMSVRMASQMYEVPAQTLRDRVKGFIDPHNARIGGEMVFTPEIELMIIEHLEAMAEHGYEHNVSRMQHIAGELAYALGKRPSDKPLSENWSRKFIQRWKGRINALKSVNVPFKSTQSFPLKPPTDYHIKYIRDILDQYMMKDKPEFIYCLKEVCIQPSRAPLNMTNCVDGTGDEERLTLEDSPMANVVTCVNWIGNSVPPYFIYQASLPASDPSNYSLMQGSTPGAKGVISPSGYLNSKIFKDYLKKHFLSHVPRGVSKNQPIVLMYTGHTSYSSTELSKWAESYNVILVDLPPTSPLLQPLSVSLFEPFINRYHTECKLYKKANKGRAISRFELCDLASKAYLIAMTPGNIISGFQRVHIYTERPVNTYKKVPPSESENNNDIPDNPSAEFNNDTPERELDLVESDKGAIMKYLYEKSVKYEDQRAGKKNGRCVKSEGKSHSRTDHDIKSIPCKREVNGNSKPETKIEDNNVNFDYLEDKEVVPAKKARTLVVKIRKDDDTNMCSVMTDLPQSVINGFHDKDHNDEELENDSETDDANEMDDEETESGSSSD